VFTQHAGAALQHAFLTTEIYTDFTTIKRSRRATMAAHMTIAMIAFVAISVLFIVGLLVTMHLRHRYQPNLIGALIGALLCFILLETLPVLM
jgi:hypothetical protein